MTTAKKTVNNGMNAEARVELVLAGLGSCLTAGIAAVAEMRDIELNPVSATLEGEMNILEIASDLRNGESAWVHPTSSVAP